MKKLVSIFAVIAVMLMSFSTVVLAADIEFVLETDASSYEIGDEIELVISADQKVTGLGFKVQFDTKAFSVAEEDGEALIYPGSRACSFQYKVDENGFAVAGGEASSKKVEVIAILCVNEGTVSGDYTFTPVIQSENTTLDNVEFENIVAEPITIHVDGVEAPIVPEGETVTMAAPAYMTEATASEETAGWQVGQGVALKFTVADLAEFVAMNWKLTCENIGTKYAKVADEDFAAIKASSADTIDVFASFIVNSKDAKETVNAITAVGAGFKKADGTVVETK